MLQRHLAPTFVKTTSLELPTPTRISLSPEVNLLLVSGVKQNVCKVELILQAGKWSEPKVGVSYFTAQLIEKGTKNKTSSAIAELFDYYGAHLEINAGYDFVSVALFTLKDHLLKLLPLLQELLLAPSFLETEWKLMRTIFIQNLKVSNEKTSSIASKNIRRNVFGNNHTYGRSVEEQDVNALTIEDFKNFYQTSFKIRHVLVCGELITQEMDFISTEFNSLFSTERKTSIPVYQDSIPSTLHIEKESVQSSIRLGKKSILKTHSDYAGLVLINHLLGGFFGSRLMKNIREEKGLTYGIHSSIYSFQQASMFAIEADVNKSNLPLALKEIKLEIEKLRNRLVADEELTLAKNHFIGGLQTEIANPFSVAEKIKNIELNGLEHDFYSQLILRIDQTTPDQIRSLSQKYFDESSFFEVTVG